MNAIEAMEWAADYAARNKLFDPPMKSNGYVVDGYKPITAPEKVDMIIKIAATVVEPLTVSTFKTPSVDPDDVPF